MFKIINGVIDFLTHKMPIPSNRAERHAVMDALRDGYWILKNGAPDFLLMKDGVIEFIEVKLEEFKRDKNGGLSIEQALMRDIFVKHGFKYTIKYVPILSPRSRPNKVKYWMDAKPMQVNDLVYSLIGKQITIESVYSAGLPLKLDLWHREFAAVCYCELVVRDVFQYNNSTFSLEVSPESCERLRNWLEDRNAELSCQNLDQEYIRAMREISKDFHKKDGLPCTEEPIFDDPSDE